MANIDKRSWKECKNVIDDPSASDAEKASAQKRMDEIKAWLNSQKEPKSAPKDAANASVKQAQALPECNWPEITRDFAPISEQLMGGLNIVTATAVRATESERTGLDSNSRDFGMIVSATKGHILQLMQIEAQQKLTKALIEVLENLPTKKAK